jgi:hypothetical protein
MELARGGGAGSLGAPKYRGNAEERKREKNGEAKVRSVASAPPRFRDKVPPLRMEEFSLCLRAFA